MRILIDTMITMGAVLLAFWLAVPALLLALAGMAFYGFSQFLSPRWEEGQREE